MGVTLQFLSSHQEQEELYIITIHRFLKVIPNIYIKFAIVAFVARRSFALGVSPWEKTR